MRRTAAALFLCAAFWTSLTIPPAGAQAPIEQTGSAEEMRSRAQRTLAAHERGEASTQEAIARFEELVRLYPDDHHGWVDLAYLYYRKANDLPAARRAAERATETAGEERERAVALDALADILIAQGDLAAARVRIEEALHHPTSRDGGPPFGESARGFGGAS